MTDSVEKSHSADKDTTSWKEAPYLLIKGFLMGSADIVPGVSGGTLALILGIYTRLIHAIRSVNMRFFRSIATLRWKTAADTFHWRFVVLLFTGIALAIFFFTRVVPLQVYMYTRPELVFGLFFGLIVGSIYILVKEVDAFDWKHGALIVAGALLGLRVVTLVPAETPETGLFVFLSGAIAICAMILPGISGSYILLILRKYDYILSQAAALGESMEPVWILLMFGAGAVVGLALFSRLLSWLLDHYYGWTLAVLIGFLVGSLYVIWPYQDRVYEQTVQATEWVDYDDPRAVALREEPADSNMPEYVRLGEVTGTGDARMVELETVSRRLTESRPFIPYMSRDDAGTPFFWSGIIGMMIGLALVGGLDYLREA